MLRATAPIFVFPEDCYSSNAAEVTFDMGNLSFDLDSLQPEDMIEDSIDLLSDEPEEEQVVDEDSGRLENHSWMQVSHFLISQSPACFTDSLTIADLVDENPAEHGARGGCTVVAAGVLGCEFRSADSDGRTQTSV